MRIAFASTEFVTRQQITGGLAAYLDRTTQWLAYHGHDVTVVSYSEQKRTHHRRGVQVIELSPSKSCYRLQRLMRGRLSNTTRWMDFSMQLYTCLSQLHRNHAFDIIQYTNIYGIGLLPSLLLPIPSTTRLSSYRPIWNRLLGFTNTDDKVLEWLELRNIRRSQNLFCPSHWMQKTINEKMGLHVEVIPSPFFIETEQLDDSIYHQQIAGKPYILFFSSYLSALKGSFVLAEALPKVLPFHPELNVVVVGNNLPHDRERGILSSRQYFKDLCGPYSDQVIFLDALPHSNLYPIIIGARLVVLPSLADNLSNACLEAMGLGKVVVGSNGRSFDELIDDGRSGFLAEPGDADDLSRAIRNALENADLETMGSAVKERIAQQDPDVVIPQLLAYYHKVISGYKKQFNSI